MTIAPTHKQPLPACGQAMGATTELALSLTSTCHKTGVPRDGPQLQHPPSTQPKRRDDILSAKVLILADQKAAFCIHETSTSHNPHHGDRSTWFRDTALGVFAVSSTKKEAAPLSPMTFHGPIAKSPWLQNDHLS